MTHKGWVAIYRRVQDHWLWEDKPFSKQAAWIDMLLLANHDDNKFLFGNELVEVKCGSFITSIEKLRHRWGWSNTKVVNFLKLLESDEMVTRKSDTKKTVVTIVNYSVYSDYENKKTMPKRCESDTETMREHTNNNDNNYNNENNKEKNNKKEIRHKYGFYKNVLLSDADLEKLKTEFPDWEQRIERLSEYIASTGKSYKNHLATIRVWARKDKPQNNVGASGIPIKNEKSDLEGVF